MTARIIIPVEVTDANLVEAGTSIPEDDTPAWDVATTYAADDDVMHEHVLYTSAIGSNTGTTPGTDSATWIPGLATNRWKVFDGYLQDAATASGSASWEIDLATAINGVALFSIDANTIQVQLTNDTAGEVYNETFDIIDNSFITDWELWTYEPVARFPDFAITDLPPYDGKLKVTITKTGETVELGQLVMGSQIDLGVTLNGFDLDIELFSEKTPDTFGRVSAVKRGSSDVFEPAIKVLTTRIPYLRRELKKREAVATVYAFDGPTRDNEYLAFGDFERLRIRSQYGLYSDMDMTIREYVS